MRAGEHRAPKAGRRGEGTGGRRTPRLTSPFLRKSRLPTLCAPTPPSWPGCAGPELLRLKPLMPPSITRCGSMSSRSMKRERSYSMAPRAAMRACAKQETKGRAQDVLSAGFWVLCDGCRIPQACIRGLAEHRAWMQNYQHACVRRAAPWQGSRRARWRHGGRQVSARKQQDRPFLHRRRPKGSVCCRRREWSLSLWRGKAEFLQEEGD